MTEYATIKQIEFMQKLGFPGQPANLTKDAAREAIRLALEKKENGDAPIETTQRAKNGYQKPYPTNGNGKEYHLSPEEQYFRSVECALTHWPMITSEAPTVEQILKLAIEYKAGVPK